MKRASANHSRSKMPTSKVWKHFERKLDVGQCRICKKEVSCKGGNTTGLAAHLRRKHQMELTSHPSVAGLMKNMTTIPSSSSTNMNSFKDDPPLPTMDPELVVGSQLGTSVDVGLSTVPPVVKVERNQEPNQISQPMTIWERARQVKLTAEKQNRITRKIAAYLVHDMRPFSTVESKSFREMVKAIDERVVIPNRDTFSERIIPPWYELEVSKLKEELQNVDHVALTSDCWTSRSTIPYMTITAHYIDHNFEMNSKVLQTRVLNDKHTGENISVALNSSLAEWGITEKVIAITTDNASNMGKAVTISDINLQIGCFAHTLDLAAKKAVEVAKPITRKMKPVIAFLNRSHVGAQVFRETQERLNSGRFHKLINDVETRWNSTYLMYERYFEQRVAIHATFLDTRMEGNEHVYRDFTDLEVKKAETFIKIMKPFYDITLAVCSEKSPTANLIPVLKEKVLKQCHIEANDTEFAKSLKNAIKQNLGKRYTQDDVTTCLQKAMCLNTRTKFKSIIADSTWEALADEIVDLREREVTKVVVKEEKEELAEPVAKKPALIDSFIDDDDDDNDVQVVSYLKKTKKEMADEEIRNYRQIAKSANALLFWGCNRHNFPYLSRLAAKYLCIQATSVPSERIFSTSGDILSAERSALDDKVLDAMIFLKKNASGISLFTL